MSNAPLPPPNAEVVETVCQFCIVGCGYRVYKWPVGRDGGPGPDQNAMAVDLREQQGPDGDWISPNMHAVVKDKAGAFNVAIVPDKSCSVNSGLASVLILGFLVFGDVPSLSEMIGMVLIVGAGIYLFYRERVQGQDAAAEATLR